MQEFIEVRKAKGGKHLAGVKKADAEQAEVALQPQDVAVRGVHDLDHGGVGKHCRQLGTCRGWHISMCHPSRAVERFAAVTRALLRLSLVIRPCCRVLASE